jgi:UDP-2,4-diacetamido-2,4,6-trideoxy-beta-L-altropyranose hydrolase
MVVDHYFLNKDWETRISSKLYKLFIIDDLCDRPHYGNILLNQNYLPGIRSKYKKILSSKTKILLGPKYALLSPEYKATRKLIKINKKKKLQRVIVFFGASDNKEQTIKCLSILSKLNLKLLKIDIVIGLANKKKKLIEEITDKIDNATLHVQIPSLCNLMKNADLYLGSGGTTTWERCCLGLPSIVISTSGNQVRQNEYLFKKGVIKYLGKAESVSEENIRTALLMFAEGYDSTKMSKKALKITNGNGAELVSKEFFN